MGEPTAARPVGCGWVEPIHRQPLEKSRRVTCAEPAVNSEVLINPASDRPLPDVARRWTATGRWLLAAALIALAMNGSASAAPNADAGDRLFRETVAPLLSKRCLDCHSGDEPEGGLDLTSAAGLQRGGESGRVVSEKKPQDSLLLEYVSDGTMPPEGKPLSREQIEAIRRWIAAGAPWPENVRLSAKPAVDDDWWSLRPIERPAVPRITGSMSQWVRNPVDAFILSKLEEHGLQPSPEADRRTLIRRLYFDLLGLPPDPDEIDRFVSDPDPQAYEALVERLLASPHYGERWARHWLDVVHYGDTHGFDKDKLRPNAWPYRDYVIRAFNDDKPYDRFVREQLAGDVLFPDDPDAVVATGFIAAGPFDWVGHIEVREGTVEKQRVRNLDRDDMVTATMNTFVSLTVQCARCHDHKFDPVTQDDYYGLQAVFAAVDRADRPYDPDPEVARQRAELNRTRALLQQRREALQAKIVDAGGPELARLDARLAELRQGGLGKKRPEYGWHSGIEARQDVVKWVQVDLGRPRPIRQIVYVGCHDEFNNIGAGFGFPVRYRVQLADDPEFRTAVRTVLDRTSADVDNPGIQPQTLSLPEGTTARYVRITATKLAPRRNDFIFALAELMVLGPDGTNWAHGATVTSLDSIEAPPRWRRTNLVDGIYYGRAPELVAEEAGLQADRERLLKSKVPAAVREELSRCEEDLSDVERRLAALPHPARVFAAATQFAPVGQFRPTGGQPRPVHVLRRGDVRSPLRPAVPGAVAAVKALPGRFALPDDHREGDRRRALAEWIVDRRNPLTWRSIVNRLWQYHFGRGLVETPNDFGHMGAQPTHPELLDWLAVELRDGGMSLKRIHRLIVTSATYRQVSAIRADAAAQDASNRFLWRMNRRRLEAEAVRDAVLAVSGRLDERMYGPGFYAFVIDKPEHSPHYLYDRHSPDDPASHRRSVYRFIVRSVPDPFMETLDCADPSACVARRSETITPLQALVLLNDPVMVRMAEHFAQRAAAASADPAEQLVTAWRWALGRQPSSDELATLRQLAERHGLAAACRVILNTNEFIFVD